MSPSYVNTSAAALLGTHERAVYRLTLGRSGLSQLSYATGVLSWPDQVTRVVDAVGASPYGIPLGGPRPGPNDSVAVIEVRAPTYPASGDSVGDLVRAAENASPYSTVTRVERLGPVPGLGSAEQQERDESREQEQSRAQQEASDRASVFDKLAAYGDRATLTLALGLGLGLVIVVAFVAGPYIGRAPLWTGKETP